MRLHAVHIMPIRLFYAYCPLSFGFSLKTTTRPFRYSFFFETHVWPRGFATDVFRHENVLYFFRFSPLFSSRGTIDGDLCSVSTSVTMYGGSNYEVFVLLRGQAYPQQT